MNIKGHDFQHLIDAFTGTCQHITRLYDVEPILTVSFKEMKTCHGIYRHLDKAIVINLSSCWDVCVLKPNLTLLHELAHHITVERNIYDNKDAHNVIWQNILIDIIDDQNLNKYKYLDSYL